jgi:ABC-type transport system involved in cytochrome c biogenesis permease subunit
MRRILAIIIWLACFPAGAATFDQTAFEAIPILSAGRVKPLDTFARESVRFVTGSEEWGGKRSLETMLSWMASSEPSDAGEFVLVDSPDLRKRIGVPPRQRRFSPEELLSNDAFIALAQEATRAQEDPRRLSAAQKEALQVVSRIQMVRDIRNGDALTMVPIPEGPNGGWLSLSDMKMYSHEGPGEGGVPSMPDQVLADMSDILRSYRDGDLPGYADSTRRLRDLLSESGAAAAPKGNILALELTYNRLKPFQRVWIPFLLAVLLFGVSMAAPTRAAILAGWVFYLAGILTAVAGFTLRSMIALRPPVTNMYESLLWAVFGAAVLGLIFEGVYRSRIFALAGAVTGVLGFLLADAATGVLDPGLHPLEPVLRSNFWLALHVLTITSSYAAFLLSWMLAHWALGVFQRDPSGPERIRQATLWIYRSVQVGVVLLAAGTLLGGVWANFAWGRFWGWDPKETWALITLLGYVAVLHGRRAGWLRDFGFTVGVTVAFLGVVMAWYGVNFVLGSGLHSYGSSTGGLPFVMAVIGIDALFVGYVAWKVKARRHNY